MTLAHCIAGSTSKALIPAQQRHGLQQRPWEEREANCQVAVSEVCPKPHAYRQLLHLPPSKISNRSQVVRAKSELAWVTIQDASLGELMERDEIAPEKRGRELREARILCETFVVQLSVEIGARGQQRRDGNGDSRSLQEVKHTDNLSTFELGDYAVCQMLSVRKGGGWRVV